MSKRQNTETWFLDQLTKSEFFHQKLHLWGVLAVADDLQQVKGEELPWNFEHLGITPRAWSKVIHRGIKPVRVFAHPDVLKRFPRAVGYYRMLAMVSQKSMSGVGLSVEAYETGQRQPDATTSEQIAVHLNTIISRLVEADEILDERELDLWRGMAAGAQAQGSWVNAKGDAVQSTINGLVHRRLTERNLVQSYTRDWREVLLVDGRKFIFGDDPDIVLYKGERVRAAVEVKGGIDPAGVLERLGAALKSLRRIREENPTATTILVLHKEVMTETATRDLGINRAIVTNWITIEDLLTQVEMREMLFDLLEI
jgi:hypothetical protein